MDVLKPKQLLYQYYPLQFCLLIMHLSVRVAPQHCKLRAQLIICGRLLFRYHPQRVVRSWLHLRLVPPIPSRVRMLMAVPD